MKIILPLLLTFTLFLSTFTDTVICIKFKINQEFISRNLCIEKYNITNKCKGLCHLKKEISKTKQHENSKPINKIQKERDTFIDSFLSNIIFRRISSKKHHLITDEFIPNSTYLSKIFRPPKYI